MAAKGFSLVEIVIASALLIILIGAFASGIVYTQTQSALAGDRSRAVLLAEEGMEAVRSMRDGDFSLLTDGPHGLTTRSPASYGPQDCATGASDLILGSNGGFPSSNSGCVSNNTYAPALLNTSGFIFTNYYKVTNFNFSLPAGAIVEGIEARVERNQSNAACSTADYRVRIVRFNSVLNNVDRAKPGIWPTVDTVETYGGPTDLWGTTWTVGEINSSQFGLAIAVSTTISGPCASTTARIDAIQLIVHYAMHTEWRFSGASDLTGIYTRTVSIAPSEANTKRVTTTVTWMQNSFIPGKVEIVGEFTNWQAPGRASWTRPATESSYNLGGAGAINALDVQGSLVYGARVSGGLRFSILNIANPAVPQILGTLAGNPPYGALAAIHVSGNYAYLASGDTQRELQIINVANSSAPSFVTSVDLPGAAEATDVFVNGNFVYVTRNVEGSTNEFFIYNISNPAAPVLVGSMNYSAQLNAVVVIGSYAYITTQNTAQDLIVVSLANQAAPVQVASLNLGSFGPTALTSYNATLVVGRAYAIDFVTIANPLAPALTGTSNIGTGLSDSGLARAVTMGVNNNYVFAVTSYTPADFVVINACNPTTPTWLSQLNTAYNLNSIAYSDMMDRVIVTTDNAAREYMIIKPQ